MSFEHLFGYISCCIFASIWAKNRTNYKHMYWTPGQVSDTSFAH